MKLPFQYFGNPDSDKALILLHAFPLSAKMWQPQIDSLTRENLRLILPDLRGFGANNYFADIFTMEDVANDVAEMMNDLRIERALIGGLSMGGYVSFNLFRLYREKFAALLLFDTNFAADSEEKRQARFDLIQDVEQNGSSALVEKMLPNLICEFTKNHKPELVEKIISMFMEADTKAVVAALRGMAARRDHSHILSEISVPTLLIFGEEDKITNLETAEKMKKEISNAALVKIPNAGHYSNLEQPELFNDALVSFIKSVEI